MYMGIQYSNCFGGMLKLCMMYGHRPWTWAMIYISGKFSWTLMMLLYNVFSVSMLSCQWQKFCKLAFYWKKVFWLASGLLLPAISESSLYVFHMHCVSFIWILFTLKRGGHAKFFFYKVNNFIYCMIRIWSEPLITFLRCDFMVK